MSSRPATPTVPRRKRSQTKRHQVNKNRVTRKNVRVSRQNAMIPDEPIQALATSANRVTRTYAMRSASGPVPVLPRDRQNAHMRRFKMIINKAARVTRRHSAPIGSNGVATNVATGAIVSFKLMAECPIS